MLKKTISYTDYLGNDRTEDFYFNLSERELANLELKNYGGFEGLIRQMAATTDVPKLTELFEKLVLMSYGEIAPDGRRFIKQNGKLAEEFMETEAYTKLYMELITDPDKLAAFIRGVIPKDLAKDMDSPDVQNKLEDLKKEYHLIDNTDNTKE